MGTRSCKEKTNTRSCNLHFFSQMFFRLAMTWSFLESQTACSVMNKRQPNSVWQELYSSCVKDYQSRHSVHVGGSPICQVSDRLKPQAFY